MIQVALASRELESGIQKMGTGQRGECGHDLWIIISKSQKVDLVPWGQYISWARLAVVVWGLRLMGRIWEWRRLAIFQNIPLWSLNRALLISWIMFYGLCGPWGKLQGWLDAVHWDVPMSSIRYPQWLIHFQERLCGNQTVQLFGEWIWAESFHHTLRSPRWKQDTKLWEWDSNYIKYILVQQVNEKVDYSIDLPVLLSVNVCSIC